jgi:hypothetical protein
MNAAYYLLKALEAAPKGERDVYGRSAFNVVCWDLLHSIEHWVTSAHQLLDVNNWNLEPCGLIGCPNAVWRSGRTFGRLPRALNACHRSHFACSVSQI